MAIHEIIPEGERDIPFDSDAFDSPLDSPSAAGAYRFVLRPGVTTALDVDARLFFREAVRSSGWPSPSMFSFGANRPSQREDYRPQGAVGSPGV